MNKTKTSEDKDKCNYVLDPLIELYFEPKSSIGDYDRIVMDINGNWHWEHSEYYPEYYAGLRYSEMMESGLEHSLRNSVPANFIGYVTPEDPVYGEIVNSLCWYENFSSLDKLYDDCKEEILLCCRAHFWVEDEKRILDLFAYVNPGVDLFSPKRSIRCIPATLKPKPPKGYICWLTVGYSENEPAIHVFYPKRPGANIRVKVTTPYESLEIPWRHGQRGLFRDKILPIMNDQKMESYHNKHRLNFVGLFLSKSKKLEEQIKLR